MASVTLLPRREFRLIFDDDKEIKGQFGTYALEKLCRDRGIKLSEVSETFKNSDDLSLIVDYILCAAYQCHEQDRIKESFDVKRVDVYSWFDQTGGFNSEEAMKLVSHASDAEKKTETTGN
jgi:hypothetical protein